MVLAGKYVVAVVAHNRGQNVCASDVLKHQFAVSMVGDKIYPGRDHDAGPSSVLAPHEQNICSIGHFTDAVCSRRKGLIPNDEIERDCSHDSMCRAGQRRGIAAQNYEK